ncbi:MAG: DeoR family transcriptional regulator [Pirellulales bacterium]|nr:DeoR family transcriptional regulator [Pirellulales bacterium]
MPTRSDILNGFSSTRLENGALSERNDPPLIRQWILLKALAASHYGCTVEELAQAAGVSIKTIRRDLIAFTVAGFPIEESLGDHGRKHWKLGSNGYAPQTKRRQPSRRVPTQ